MSRIYTVFSLAAQRHRRSSFCSVKFDSSLAGSLQGPWAVQGWQPQSCVPLAPWAPRTCSVSHLQERPIQWKLLLCPRLCSAYFSRASKEQKGLEGEILRAVQQSQQGMEGHFPKLISVAKGLKTYWSPGTALSANTAGNALKSHFGEFFTSYLIPSFFLFLPVGLN